MRRMILCLLALLLSHAAAWAGPVAVVVSIAPQKYFVERIAGPLAQVTVMAPPGADPHSYEPRPSQMAAVANARLYMAQGVEFETVWLDKLTRSNPGLTVVETWQGIERLPLTAHEEHHGPGTHGDLDLDPHVWTAPPLVKLQAQAMARALAQADPANAAAYQANLAAFSARLDALDARIRDILSPVPKGSRFMVFHPAWAYFARQYGLEEVPIEAGGREPGPRQLKKLVEEARAARVKAVFVQPQFSTKAAQTVAQAAGAPLVPADNLAPDWENNLLAVAAAIRDAMR